MEAGPVLIGGLACPFNDVQRNRNGCPLQLIGKLRVSSWGSSPGSERQALQSAEHTDTRRVSRGRACLAIGTVAVGSCARACTEVGNEDAHAHGYEDEDEDEDEDDGRK